MTDFKKNGWASLLLAASMTMVWSNASADQAEDVKNQEQPADATPPAEGTPDTAPVEGTAPDDGALVIDQQSLEKEQPIQGAREQEVQTELMAEDRSDKMPKGKMSLRQRVALNRAVISDANRRSGKDFLAAYGAKDGVISLPDGLQYRIIKSGAGKSPREDGTVLCRYRGELTDGTTFDQTDQKQAVRLNVAGFVPGLKKAVTLMNTGAKWQVVIPPQLAYGEHGDRAIGPNAVLIYDIEIVAVD